MIEEATTSAVVNMQYKRVPLSASLPSDASSVLKI